MTYTRPKAVVQISHGLAEHAARYDRLVTALNGVGYLVYAHDHRGHGRTAGEQVVVVGGATAWRHRQTTRGYAVGR